MSGRVGVPAERRKEHFLEILMQKDHYIHIYSTTIMHLQQNQIEHVKGRRTQESYIHLQEIYYKLRII